MRFLRMRALWAVGLAALVGCAKAVEGPATAQNPPATQPANVSQANAATANAPAASMLRIGLTQQWFPPARLHLGTDHGVVIARLYSNDPKDTLTGKEVVNSYDMRMELPDISDPGQITQTMWTYHSESMDRRDTPYGIFLNSQGEVLQPMDVTASFRGEGSHLKVTLKGTFNLYKNTDQVPQPAPTQVLVLGVLDASVN